MKKIIAILIFCGLLTPFFSFAQNSIPLPENMEGVKAMGEKGLEIAKNNLPGKIKTIFTEEVLPIWQKMYSWFKTNVLDKYILPFYKKMIEPKIKEEIEKRKPAVGEEFQKEKKEIKEDIPNAKSTLLDFWQKIKDFLK